MAKKLSKLVQEWANLHDKREVSKEEVRAAQARCTQLNGCIGQVEIEVAKLFTDDDEGATLAYSIDGETYVVMITEDQCVSITKARKIGDR